MHCRMLSKVAKSHHQSPKFAISCHELSKVVKSCQKLSKFGKSCCQKLVKVVKSWQKLSLFLGILYCGRIERFLGEEGNYGRILLFLWERINCGRLIWFVGGFKYNMSYIVRMTLRVVDPPTPLRVRFLDFVMWDWPLTLWFNHLICVFWNGFHTRKSFSSNF